MSLFVVVQVTEYQLMKVVEPFGAIASFDFLYSVHAESGARTPKERVLSSTHTIRLSERLFFNRATRL